MIDRIMVENGEAKGGVLEDGTVITAKQFVCSAINPHQTFFEHIGEKHLDAEFSGRLRQWQYSDTSFFNVHTALFDAPRFTVAEKDPELVKALIYVVGYESEADLVKHLEASKRGELHDGGFNCCFPTIFDTSEAPAGRHTGLISEHAPYRLKDGGAQRWYKIRLEHAKQNIETLRKYAPNMTDDNILWTYVASIKNSLAAIEKEGEIRIQTNYDTTLQMVRGEISDDGCGISDEDKARLFEPYFSTRKTGTGLGLTIVNAIISDHNGYIRIRDNKPTGTTFLIELPVRV